LSRYLQQPRDARALQASIALLRDVDVKRGERLAPGLVDDPGQVDEGRGAAAAR